MNLPFLIVVINAVVLAVTTTHLQKTSQRKDRAIRSIALFLMVWILVGVSGMHKCAEGHAPSYLAFLFASIVASIPWLTGAHPWAIRALIVVVLSSGMTCANLLASSYHQNNITGNPDFASGRFWHTPFTGQYPRDHDKTQRGTKYPGRD